MVSYGAIKFLEIGGQRRWKVMDNKNLPNLRTHILHLIRSIPILGNHPSNPCVLVSDMPFQVRLVSRDTPCQVSAVCLGVVGDSPCQIVSVCLVNPSVSFCECDTIRLNIHGVLLNLSTPPTVVPLLTADATPTTPHDHRHNLNIPVKQLAPTFWALSTSGLLVPLIAFPTQLVVVPAHHLIVVVVQVLPADRTHFA
jgi:hypothetical protein